MSNTEKSEVTETLRYPPDGGLPEQKRTFEETLSAFDVMRYHFDTERMKESVRKIQLSSEYGSFGNNKRV